MNTKDPAKRNPDKKPADRQQGSRNDNEQQQSGGHGGPPSRRTGVRHPERSGSLTHDPEPGRSDYFKI